MGIGAGGRHRDEDWPDRHRHDWVVGTLDEVAERIGELEKAGVQRVMLQHLAHDDLTMVALLGEIARRCPS